MVLDDSKFSNPHSRNELSESNSKEIERLEKQAQDKYHKVYNKFNMGTKGKTKGSKFKW